MTEINSFRKDILKKKREALIKINFFREDFRKKEKEVKTDLEKASRRWKEVSERFKWWQTLP